MRYSFIIQAAMLVSSAAFGRADDCDDPQAPFAAITTGGVPFDATKAYQNACDSKWSVGEVIVGIEAWSADFQVKAVRVKHSSSGWGPVHGTVDGFAVKEHASKEWKADEEVGVRLWANKPDDGDPIDGVGKIQITQNGQSIFEVGAKADKIQAQEQIIDNGGGKILGVVSQTGSWVSSLEFKMLKASIVSSVLTDITLAEDLTKWNDEQKGIDRDVNLADIYYVNKNPVGGSNLTYSFANTATRDESTSITSQRTNQWAVGTTITVGGGISIPLLAEAKVEVAGRFDYTRVNLDGKDTTVSKSKTLTWSVGSPSAGSLLEPQTAAHCAAWAISGTFKSDYTATVTNTLSDGSKFVSQDAGNFESIGYVTGASSCEVVPIKDVPSNGNIQEANGIGGGKKRALKFVS